MKQPKVHHMNLSIESEPDEQFAEERKKLIDVWAMTSKQLDRSAQDGENVVAKFEYQPLI